MARRTCIPTFLERQWHFGPNGAGSHHRHLRDRRHSWAGWPSDISPISGAAARAIVTAFVLAALLIPLWAYAPNMILLVIGAFLMQFMVQGAWGVIPAHLAELSPDSVRALLPGFAYQSAGVIASSVPYIEALYAQKTSYSTAMALTAICVFVLASIMALARPRAARTEIRSRVSSSRRSCAFSRRSSPAVTKPHGSPMIWVRASSPPCAPCPVWSILPRWSADRFWPFS